ncbi:MAG: hypothetical protein WBK67_01040 [Minisyncoccales bacterium]|jgi:hypothetical protein
MKILAISNKPPKASIKSILNYQDLDLICLLGDLDLFSLSELEFITKIPKIGVYGDKCSGTYFGKLGVEDLHLKTYKYNGILFGGFQGSVIDGNSKPNSFTQEESIKLLKEFPRVDVMISHSPPYGINDNLKNSSELGFLGLRKYISEKSPRILIHGNDEPLGEFMVEIFENTKIIYVRGEKLIEI